jgi:curved DNA-binding protein CbpA
MTANYYTLLGVAQGAEDEIIRAAYLVLAKRYHPDTATAASPHSGEQFRIITEAYEVLRDPTRRAYYDWCYARKEQNLARQKQLESSQEEQEHREVRDPAKRTWSSAIDNPLIYSAGAVALVVALVFGVIKVIVSSGPSANTDLAIRTEKSERSSSFLSDKAVLQELTDLRRTLQQMESLAATNQESAAQERARNQELEKQLAAREDNDKQLAEERARNEELEKQPAARRHAMPVDGHNAIASLSDTLPPTPPAAPPTRSNTQVMSAAENTATLVRPEAPASNPQATRLMARAGVLLGQGNIGPARTVLERAAELGSAAALFVLAETYDPALLSAWGTLGTQGDLGKAQELYAKAFASGVQEAKDRLNALRY